MSKSCCFIEVSWCRSCLPQLPFVSERIPSALVYTQGESAQHQFQILWIEIAILGSDPESVHKVRSIHASSWGDKTRDFWMGREHH